jgi:hypothetical protein
VCLATRDAQPGRCPSVRSLLTLVAEETGEQRENATSQPSPRSGESEDAEIMDILAWS